MKTFFFFIVFLVGYILPAYVTWSYVKPLVDTTGSEYAEQGKILKNEAVFYVLCPMGNIFASLGFIIGDTIEFAGDVLFDNP